MNLKQVSLAVAIVLSTALAGCGGGGGGGDSGSGPVSPTDPVIPQPEPNPNPNPNPNPTPEPNPGLNNVVSLCTSAEANCGNQSNSTYSGSNTGIWGYENNTNSPVTVPYSISGVQNKNVTKSIVNLSITPASLSATSFRNEVQSSDIQKSVVSQQEKMKALGAQFKSRLDAEDAEVIKNIVSSKAQSRGISAMRVAPTSIAQQFIGDVKMFNQSEGATNVTVARNYTLSEKGTLSDGRILNVWVESSELGPNKITNSDIQKIKSGMLKTYASSIALSGTPYSVEGTTKFGFLIPDSPLQPINVMLSNITPDNTGYGVLGYYASRNNQTKAGNPLSNEALQVYLDTETIYRPYGTTLGASDESTRNISLELVQGTLTHEFTHLIAFHQRVLLKEYTETSTFMSEAIALASEDILRSVSGYNSDYFRDNRAEFFSYGYGADCQFNNWACYNMYENTSVFMAYLVRQYGVKFYKDYLADISSTNDAILLNNAIKANGGVSLENALMKFQVLRAGLTGNAVNAFGLPAVNSGGYSLKSYNDNFPVSINLTQPTTLDGLGASHYHTVDNTSSVSGSIVVPAKSALVIVVK